jgi:hypothetical protein
MPWLRNRWTRDLRHAIRALRRSPGFFGSLTMTIMSLVALIAAPDH